MRYAYLVFVKKYSKAALRNFALFLLLSALHTVHKCEVNNGQVLNDHESEIVRAPIGRHNNVFDRLVEFGIIKTDQQSSAIIAPIWPLVNHIGYRLS